MHIVATLVIWLVACTAVAQGYPNRPVRVVVPWPPGQATDIAARVVAQKLQESLSQPFVIENKPGAGGAIGSDIVAKSPADGYTLLAASSGPISIMPNLQKIPYDPLKDFAPVGMVAVTPFALVTHPALFAGSAAEEEKAHASVGRSLLVLTVATVGIAWMSEIMVGAIEPTTREFGFSSLQTHRWREADSNLWSRDPASRSDLSRV